MKNAARALAMVITILPLLAGAQAANHKISAKVPFEFMAGDKLAPAGAYSLTIAGWGLDTALIQNRDAKFNLYTSVATAERLNNLSSSALIFHRYGNQYFLVGVRMGNTMATYELPSGKVEKELRARNAPEKDEILLASAQ